MANKGAVSIFDVLCEDNTRSNTCRRRKHHLKLLFCPWSLFPTATSTLNLDVPAVSRRARTESVPESRSAVAFSINFRILPKFGIFGDFSKNWEMPELILGGHTTTDRALARIKLIFRSAIGNSASTSEIQKPRLRSNSGVLVFGTF